MIETRLYCEAVKREIEAFLKDPSDDHLITAKAILDEVISKLPPETTKPDWITDSQWNEIEKLYMRDPEYAESFSEFVSTVFPQGGYAAVIWKGMYIGIEQDGYTHT